MRKLPGFKRNLTKFILDLTIFIGYLLVLDPRTTGGAIHEWLAVAVAATIVVHLLLSWNWIVEVPRRFLGKITWRARINYLLNWLFFIDVVLIMLTGIMISEVVLPSIGIQLPRDSFWKHLHVLTTDLSIFILGLHVALNWAWIVNMIKHIMIRPVEKLHSTKEISQEQGRGAQA